MNGRLLVCIASRDRNLALERAIQSILKTSTQADIAIYIDEDQIGLYGDLLNPPQQVKFVIGPRVGACESLNHLVAQHPGYSAYGAAVDDCEFVSPGWDQWVLAELEKMPKGIGLLSPKIPGSQRMDFPWASGAWIKLVGYLVPPKIHHFYWDVALEILGEQTHISRADESQFLIVHDDAPSEDLN